MQTFDGLVMFDDAMRQELREKQLEMLKLFISICQKNDLTYYLVGGTALGAIRHGGFIPWDDDIDLAMPRPDYEKFMEIGQRELPEGFFLQNHKTDPDYRNDFAKIRNSNTVYLEATAVNIKINHGIYIDIFPIDGYPEKRRSQKKLEFKKNLAKYYLSKDYIIANNTLKRKMRLGLIKLIFLYRAPSQVIDKLEKMYKKYSYDTSEIVVCHGGAWGKLEQCEKAQYGQGVEGCFEGVIAKLPEKTHEYLAHKYGNYMELPPIEKRIGHHYCKKVVFDKFAEGEM